MNSARASDEQVAKLILKVESELTEKVIMSCFIPSKGVTCTNDPHLSLDAEVTTEEHKNYRPAGQSMEFRSCTRAEAIVYGGKM